MKIIPLIFGITFCAATAVLAEGSAPAEHVTVFQKDGRFAAWPANGGMWAWGDEILVCYTEGDHLKTKGHSYDPATVRSMFARSLDGGQTWTHEDAHAQGISASGHDHRLHERQVGSPSLHSFRILSFDSKRQQPTLAKTFSCILK